MALNTAALPVEPLDASERDVLRAVGRGLSTAEVAAELCITEVAVRNHLGRIVTRFGLDDEEPPPVPGPRLPAVTSERGEPTLRLAMLGPVQAWRGRERVDLGPVRQQAMLAALALRPDVTVSPRALLDAVWGLEPPAAKVIPVYVYRLRRCLRAAGRPAEATISSDRGGYRFVSARISVDSTRLEELAAQARAAGRAGDLASASVILADALTLFRGEPLMGLPGPFAEGERHRLAERRIALLQEKLEWQLRLGNHSDTIGELSSLLVAHPHNETLAELLMRALHSSGRQADALTVFTRLRRRLVQDLGVEPGELLRAAQQAVLRGR